MKRKVLKATAWVLVGALTFGLFPVHTLAAESASGSVTDTTVGSDDRASQTGGAVNPNDPRNYPSGYYPGGAEYGMGGHRSKIPMLIGAAFGGLLGAHFGIVGTLAGAAAGGVVGHLVGGQLGEAPYGNYYDNYNNRLDRYYSDYYSNLGGHRSRLGILPGIAGGVFGALLGSSFGGTLGLIAGGIGGFLVGQVFARVLFPQQYYDNYYAGGNYPFDNFRQMPQPFQNPNQLQGYSSYTGMPGYYPTYQVPGTVREGYYGGGNPAANLSGLRAGFFKATTDYESALKSGSQDQKLKARQQFESARDAYFSKKGQ